MAFWEVGSSTGQNALGGANAQFQHQNSRLRDSRAPLKGADHTLARPKGNRVGRIGARDRPSL
jgi:hypothetical protein